MVSDNRGRRASDSEPVVKVRDLVTRFDDRVVHNGLSLDIRCRQVTAIVGGSGSGKSTLMREIVMLQEVTSGSIKVFGTEVVGLSDIAALPLRRRIGVLFQNGALFGDMTVLENVGVPLREHTELSDQLIDEVALMKLSLAGLERSVAALYPSQLSGGMRKRAAMARAIALDPELLFLDEPNSGLDPLSADELDSLVLRLKDLLGLTIVLVTHDMDSLWKITDEVILLGKGDILAVGSMQTLARSEEPEVKRFFRGVRGRLSTQAADSVGSGA